MIPIPWLRTLKQQLNGEGEFSRPVRTSPAGGPTAWEGSSTVGPQPSSRMNSPSAQAGTDNICWASARAARERRADLWLIGSAERGQKKYAESAEPQEIATRQAVTVNNRITDKVQHKK